MPAACSLAVHALLNELNQEVDLVNVRTKAGEEKNAEFLKANPRGQVPVLVDGDFILREGAAILTYLADKHNSDLLPKSGRERAHALEWLMFANATLHPAYSRVFYALFHNQDEAVKKQLCETGAVQINKLWAEVDAQLGKTKFVAGEKITLADILLTVIANWGIGVFPFEIKLGDNLKRMLKEISARPSFKKALEKEGVQYKKI